MKLFLWGHCFLGSDYLLSFDIAWKIFQPLTSNRRLVINKLEIFDIPLRMTWMSCVTKLCIFTAWLIFRKSFSPLSKLWELLGSWRWLMSKLIFWHKMCVGSFSLAFWISFWICLLCAISIHIFRALMCNWIRSFGSLCGILLLSFFTQNLCWCIRYMHLFLWIMILAHI